MTVQQSDRSVYVQSRHSREDILSDGGVASDEVGDALCENDRSEERGEG
jgi:hypothetical protein